MKKVLVYNVIKADGSEATVCVISPWRLLEQNMKIRRLFPSFLKATCSVMELDGSYVVWPKTLVRY